MSTDKDKYTDKDIIKKVAAINKILPNAEIRYDLIAARMDYENFWLDVQKTRVFICMYVGIPKPYAVRTKLRDFNPRFIEVPLRKFAFTF